MKIRNKPNKIYSQMILNVMKEKKQKIGIRRVYCGVSFKQSKAIRGGLYREGGISAKVCGKWRNEPGG